MPDQDRNRYQIPIVNLLRTTFGISLPVNRKTYFSVGFSLMLLKYTTEASVLYFAAHEFLDPISFLIPSLAWRLKNLITAQEWLVLAVSIWNAPFLWVAVTMSIRRAIDAGRNPFQGLAVLIPVVNLFIMAGLAIAPTVATEQISLEASTFNSRKIRQEKRLVFSAILGVVIGGLFAVLLTFISANLMHNYGASLFMGMPIVSGTVASFIYNQPFTRGLTGSISVGVLSVVLGGMGLLLFALEGVICLVMASPLILPIGALGGLLGWSLSKVIIWQSKWMLGGALIAIAPISGCFEMIWHQPHTRMVQTVINIDATQNEVWEQVVSFPDIESAPPWYFQFGIATPIRARIDGTGVGATRHCEFTTGTFVEPITVWDRPNRLAFDVAQQPDPLIELTPYRHVRPPHLAHSFFSVKGEFELKPNVDGTTRLIGRTWYVVDMGPEIYWSLWTDAIIHRIHQRVLEHIADQATSSGTNSK